MQLSKHTTNNCRPVLRVLVSSTSQSYKFGPHPLFLFLSFCSFLPLPHAEEANLIYRFCAFLLLSRFHSMVYNHPTQQKEKPLHPRVPDSPHGCLQSTIKVKSNELFGSPNTNGTLAVNVLEFRSCAFREF